MTTEIEYQRQLESQIKQYEAVEVMHNLPDAAQYLLSRYHRSRVRDVFGVESVPGIYAKHIAEAVDRSGQWRAISLGAGYCAQEIEIVKWAKANNLSDFQIVCLELSPLLVQRAREAARSEGVEDFVVVQEADLNKQWPIDGPVAAVMVHQALHHFVELENIFGQIDDLMHTEGSFITIDMIGRNGHRRWPETLGVLRQIWTGLPERVKWDHALNRLDRWFENWDCSVEGFEGIRAQDILPELVKRFRFEKFYANGGIIDIFYDRRFGPNFSTSDDEDCQFLGAVQALEDHLIDDGFITPTQGYAVMRHLQSSSCPPAPICFNGRTPEKCLRLDDRNVELPVSILDRLFSSPYSGQPMLPPLLRVAAGEPLSFGDRREGVQTMRWGWAQPDPNFTWSLGYDSALEFQVGDTVDQLRIDLVGLLPPTGEQPILTIRTNGQSVTTLPVGAGRQEHLVKLPLPLMKGTRALLEFENSRPRRRDNDGGEDARQIGFALISLTLDKGES
ncbi:class I SAM-dependent methyltransferase [Methyloceanibacter sp. wino2]|uniref:methyltransferase domain-containing protein n=1 Tax=Methyloceanibacter sp. wino2 TaxID=2170729 RepID=UPI000D3EB790|nr:class I SAM-dependent methyltransferase [Methyloceanibacter sp. wino2]